MKINENWKLEPDTRSWNTYEKTYGINRKTGKKGENIDITYHSTLKNACEYLLDNIPKKYAKERKDIIGLLNEVKKARKQIVETLILTHSDTLKKDLS